MASRREAERWIAAGRVAVNGVPAVLGQRVGPEDRVTVDGEAVRARRRKVVLAVYKPEGYTTSLRDPHAQHLVRELVPPGYGRVFPVGRLDRDSAGLLLMTNDGDLAFRLTHPRFGLEKEYRVWVEGVPGPNHLQRLQRGVALEEGMARASAVRVLRRQGGKSLVQVVLREGKKREIRRLFQAVGHPVLSLCRVRIGPVQLGDMKPGEVRELGRAEVQALREAVALTGDGPGPNPQEGGKRQWSNPARPRDVQEPSGPRRTPSGRWRRSGSTSPRTAASAPPSRRKS